MIVLHSFIKPAKELQKRERDTPRVVQGSLKLPTFPLCAGDSAALESHVSEAVRLHQRAPGPTLPVPFSTMSLAPGAGGSQTLHRCLRNKQTCPHRGAEMNLEYSRCHSMR